MFTINNSKMNRIFYFFIILFFVQSVHGQSSFQDKSKITAYVKEMLIQDFDSVVISYQVENLNEISSSPAIVSVNAKRKTVLSAKEVKCLNRLLKDAGSYSDQLSGLGDRDITFLYYKRGLIDLSIHVSSITRDISIINNKNVMQNRISSRFEKYLVKLLRKKGIWGKNQIFTEF